MEDKTFELLEMMYIEMQEMKQNMATKDDMANMATKDDIANMATKDDIANMATKDDIANMATKQDIVRLENKIDANNKALYDGYRQSVEGIAEINERLDKLTERVDNHEIELQVLKSAK